MLCTGAGHAAGQNLAALGRELAQTAYIFVIDVLDLINTELANLPAGLMLATGTARSAIGFIVIRFRHCDILLIICYGRQALKRQVIIVSFLHLGRSRIRRSAHLGIRRQRNIIHLAAAASVFG